MWRYWSPHNKSSRVSNWSIKTNQKFKSVGLLLRVWIFFFSPSSLVHCQLCVYFSFSPRWISTSEGNNGGSQQVAVWHQVPGDLVLVDNLWYFITYIYIITCYTLLCRDKHLKDIKVKIYIREDGVIKGDKFISGSVRKYHFRVGNNYLCF